jgi:hypothetical protein
MALSTNAHDLLDRLAVNGRAANCGSAKAKLGLSSPDFADALEELVETGLAVLVGKGRVARTTVGSSDLSVDAAMLLAALPGDGSTVGNYSLRSKLNLDDETYTEAKGELRSAKWARSSELSEDRLDSPKHLPSQSPVYVVELPAKRATQQASRGPQYPFDALQLFAVTPAIGRVELRRHATLDVGGRGQTELQRAEHVGFGNFPRSARTATRLTATGDLGHGGAVASSRDARLRFDPVGV